MSKLRLTLACWDYDRTRALADGRVTPEGIDLNLVPLHVEETFFRMLRNREFDAAEMSLSSYSVSLMRDDPAFIAIPVFPSRFFRHSCIFVSAKSGIREPKDLIGKRIGTPEFQMTAPVWIRGILAEHYGVPVDSVTYYTGGEEEPGRSEKIKLDLPPSIKVVPIGPTNIRSCRGTVSRPSRGRPRPLDRAAAPAAPAAAPASSRAPPTCPRASRRACCAAPGSRSPLSR